MSDNYGAQNIELFLETNKQLLWDDLLEGKKLSTVSMGEFIDLPEYVQAVRQVREDAPVIERIADSIGERNFYPKFIPLEELVKIAQYQESNYQSQISYTDQSTLAQMGGPRVQAPALLKEVNQLLEAIPAIQAMQEAQGKTDNPVLKIKVAREVFEGLEKSTQDAVRGVLKLARYKKMDGSFIEESKVKGLENLLTLSGAMRPASRGENIAETIASLRENPAQTISSGIQDVAQHAAKSSLHAVKLVPVAGPAIGAAVDLAAKGVQALQNSWNFMNRGQDR